MYVYIAIICCAVVAVESATTTEIPPQINFTRIDTNNDGKISIAEVDAVFDQTDTDDDGHITLQEYMVSAGLSKQQALPIFNFFDTDKDGDITKAETNKSFTLIDKNGDGGVTPQEMAQAFRALAAALGGGVGK